VYESSDLRPYFSCRILSGQLILVVIRNHAAQAVEDLLRGTDRTSYAATSANWSSPFLLALPPALVVVVLVVVVVVPPKKRYVEWQGASCVVAP